MKVSRNDFASGLLTGIVTGLGVGLLLAPRRGQAYVALQQSELGRRASEAAPLIFEAGLVLLAQARPMLGRLAWGLVHLAGRTRPREGGR